MELQLFSTQAGRPLDWEVFQRHPLGQLYLTIPFQEYAAKIPYEASSTGRRPWFDLQGGIALQVLKHYYGLSDEKLIDLLNQNKMMQYFCGINLSAGQMIKDADVVSRWRSRLGYYLSDDQILLKVQLAQAEYWQDRMSNREANLSDATCYESHVRYPTDVKLLWESISYLYAEMKIIYAYVGLPMIRSKYKDQRVEYLSYQRRRRKTHKEGRKRKKALLYLLNKYLDQMPVLIALMKQHQSRQLFPCRIKSNFFDRLSTIKQVYQQQQLLYDQPGAKIQDRIVSLCKPYLRPIVRGKENKRVEFGMKLHEMQVDGINFIEHWSFNAFHEGIRMKTTLWRHQYLFHQKCRLFGGDQIYANNANRRYCSKQQVQNCFVPKGRQPADPVAGKQKRQLRQIIAKHRATRLEGSFGNKKNHYLLGRIKAKHQFTEMAWIFFGNLTANAVKLSKRPNPPPPTTGLAAA